MSALKRIVGALSIALVVPAAAVPAVAITLMFGMDAAVIGAVIGIVGAMFWLATWDHIVKPWAFGEER